LRRWYPDVKIFARAKDKDHAYRLQSTLDVAAMVPILPEDNVLLTLPFGRAYCRWPRRPFITSSTIEEESEPKPFVVVGMID
jgi:hypothetical protein